MTGDGFVPVGHTHPVDGAQILWLPNTRPGPTAPTTVVIPTHPARGGFNVPGALLSRAVASVWVQEWVPAGGIVIATDTGGRGAAHTRQAALDAALAMDDPTEFVSFLDSDDTLYPNHLRVHAKLLADGADVAYSYFDGNEPFGPEGQTTHRGRVWDPAAPHHITMTVTVRSELARKATFLRPGGPMHQEWAGEDWFYLLGLNELGARFVGTGEVTWTYCVHQGNTSGLPGRGDAA